MAIARSTLAAALLCALAHTGAEAQQGTSPERETRPADSQVGESSRRHPVERVRRSAAGQPKQARTDKRQLQLKGKVSEVWQAPVYQGGAAADTVVLVETEQGQLVAANLGPAARLEGVELEQGTPVMVAGVVARMGQERLFVPGRVQVGERPMDLQQEPVRLTRPKQRELSGKIIETRKLGAKTSDAPEIQMAVIETAPEERVIVEMGPADPLAGLALSEGQRVEIKGFETRMNEQEWLMAQELRAGEAKVRIQRESTSEAQGEQTPAR